MALAPQCVRCRAVPTCGALSTTNSLAHQKTPPYSSSESLQARFHNHRVDRLCVLTAHAANSRRRSGPAVSASTTALLRRRRQGLACEAFWQHGSDLVHPEQAAPSAAQYPGRWASRSAAQYPSAQYPRRPAGHRSEAVEMKSACGVCVCVCWLGMLHARHKHARHGLLWLLQ